MREVEDRFEKKFERNILPLISGSSAKADMKEILRRLYELEMQNGKRLRTSLFCDITPKARYRLKYLARKGLINGVFYGSSVFKVAETQNKILRTEEDVEIALTRKVQRLEQHSNSDKKVIELLSNIHSTTDLEEILNLVKRDVTVYNKTVEHLRTKGIDTRAYGYGYILTKGAALWWKLTNRGQRLIGV